VTRVHEESLSGFGVLELDPTGVGEIVLARIVHRDGDHLVPRGDLGHRVLPALRPEIGQHHHDGPVAQQLGGVAQRAARFVPRPRGANATRSRITRRAWARPSRAARRTPHVGEEQRADAIVVARRASASTAATSTARPALVYGRPKCNDPD